MTISRRARVQEKRLAARTKRLFFITTIFIIASLFIAPQFFAQLSLHLKPKETGELLLNQRKELPFPPTLDPLLPATNSSNLTISGTSQPGILVRLYQNGFKLMENPVAKDGSFLINRVSLTEGDNIFTATTVREEQESLPSNAISILYKTDIPLLEILSPNDNQTLTGEEPETVISGRTEPEAQVTINGRIIPTASDGSFSTTVKLKQGENILTARARDIAGNESAKELSLIYQP